MGPTFMMTEEKVTQSEAASKCAEWGGSLAVLDTLEKRAFVKANIPVDTWVLIGAKCVDCEVVEDDKWQWANGKKLSIDDPMWGDYGTEGQAPWDNT